MLEKDSILSVSSPAYTIASDSAAKHSARPLTPYQVLRMLPKDATPAQQDSAVQAWFQPNEIHYSERPDTLHLPGEGIPRDLKEVNIPQYYRENFFSNDTLYHEEVGGGSYGVAGAPLPYSIQNDSIVTGLLILCFLFIMFVFSRISSFLLHQIKNFFYSTRGDHTLIETGTEIKYQLLLLPITCIIYALFYYFYAINYISDTFILSSDYVLLIIYFGVFLVYFLLKAVLYSIVNNNFFGSKKNIQFLKAALFITSMEGLALFPLVLLLGYFHFSMQNAIIYTVFILFTAKFLTSYKAFVIFFKQNEFILQIILYLCALEIVPLSFLWTGLSVITSSLEVNF